MSKFLFSDIFRIRTLSFIYLAIAALLLPLFFINFPFDTSVRSIKALLDVGHIFFFLIFVLALNSFAANKTLSLRWVLKVLFLVLILGIMIELFQTGLIGRKTSLSDVLRNLCGGIIAIIWLYMKRVKVWQKIILFLTLLALITVGVTPLGVALLDEYHARAEFPVLASFESKSELTRWHARTPLLRVKNPVSMGSYSLRLQLTTEKFSGIELHHFPSDWQGYRLLKLSVYNPESSVLSLTLRLHDKLHEQRKQLYSDRFSKEFQIISGWNDIVVPLVDIQNGPENRMMKLDEMANIDLFTKNLATERLIFIDDVRLLQ